MTELKPCPFCGGQPDIAISKYGRYVACPCSLNPRTDAFEDVSKAIEQWNNRPSPWHAGTPTEEGRYLIENIDGYNEILEWYNGHWYEEDPNSVDCRCKVSDSWVVAWLGQKIEPYKEDNYGR